MSMTREDHELIADLVADAVNAGFEKLRADLYEKMLALRSPTWAISPKGEVFIDGQLAGDIRPAFQSAVNAALRVAQKPKRQPDSMPPNCPVDACPCNDGSMEPGDCTIPDCPNQ